jgi:hypothetical protein
MSKDSKQLLLVYIHMQKVNRQKLPGMNLMQKAIIQPPQEAIHMPKALIQLLLEITLMQRVFLQTLLE